jgi:hypothetical protein
LNYEVWKDIPGYEGRYMASTFGRIRSLDMVIPTKGGSRRLSKGRLLKNYLTKDYYSVRLYNGKEKKGHAYHVHTLVAITFIPRIDGCDQINHKDENKLNNRVENLEWCTSSYNLNYGTRVSRITKTRTRLGRVNAEIPVRQYDNSGAFVKEYISISEASRQTGIKLSKISYVCCGKRNSAGGFGWRYVSENLDTIPAIAKKNKSVAQFLEDGTFVSSYESLHDAERETGILRQCITPAIKRGGIAGGFIWKYLD